MAVTTTPILQVRGVEIADAVPVRQADEAGRLGSLAAQIGGFVLDPARGACAALRWCAESPAFEYDPGGQTLRYRLPPRTAPLLARWLAATATVPVLVLTPGSAPATPAATYDLGDFEIVAGGGGDVVTLRRMRGAAAAAEVAVVDAAAAAAACGGGGTPPPPSSAGATDGGGPNHTTIAPDDDDATTLGGDESDGAAAPAPAPSDADADADAAGAAAAELRRWGLADVVAGTSPDAPRFADGPPPDAVLFNALGPDCVAWCGEHNRYGSLCVAWRFADYPDRAAFARARADAGRLRLPVLLLYGATHAILVPPAGSRRTSRVHPRRGQLALGEPHDDDGGD